MKVASLRIGSLMILAALLMASPAAAEQTLGAGSGRLELKMGHSLVADLPRPVARVSVGKPDIADVLVINSRQLYVNGKAPGSTNLTLWDKKDHLMGVYTLRVVRDLTRLKEQLYRIMPREPIQVHEMEGRVLLSGRVSSLEAKRRAEAIAKALAPKQVTSVLRLGGSQQVLLKVRFAEVSRTAMKKLNFNLGFFNPAGAFAFTFLQGLVQPSDTAIGLDSFSTKLDFSKNLKGMWGFDAGGARFLGFLDALKENGLAKILAEPNLVATSGHKAEFLAGGEFPIPVPQKDYVTIEFKKFGVQLNFTPEVLDDGRIRLTVEPEVSELDYTNAVVIDTFTVPGLITRRAKTQLELRSGQSFAIAGLFRDDITHTISKLPFLGDIPILGTLFRSTDFRSKKTELVIVVTPELVTEGVGKPPRRLPGEDLREPDEFSLFLLAELTGPRRKPAAIPLSPRELEGRFGHAVVY